ncbi:DUF1461 domain-containing protein [Anaerotardibacter muris]|uniref:lipoprotein intramolecular transacylase Lit n=1 Tax=Anaerotardibacter muris TaxID=2941505 RepID=UPI002041A8B9|nr:DUF1461 domain-containing protein [Anaerotardibacter muris]
MVKRSLDIVIAALTALLLAFGLFGSGLVACMLPQTTQLLGDNFSGWNDATYPQETMEELAEAVRSFSIEDTGRQALEDAVAGALAEHYPEISASLNRGGELDGANQNVGGNLFAGGLGIGNVISVYTLPASAVDHLQDCIPIFVTSRIAIILSLVFALLGVVLLIIRRRRKLAGWVLFVTPLVVIATIAALGIWAFVDFDSLFTALHGLFFANGTWIFPADSLLITLFPEAFWMGMGVVWVFISILACLVVCLIGRFVKR